MATAGEGAAAEATAAASSYPTAGGEGVGGKFRKRPFRRAHHTTPYDRPLTALRGITTAAASNHESSWLTKFVVEPASKLISFGAQRFFASVFRKRLSPPPQPAEANNESTEQPQQALPNDRSGAKEPSGNSNAHQVNLSDVGGISELEQLLKQKTFTRPEIERLTELLRSRAEEVPIGKNPYEALPELATDMGRHQQYLNSPLEGDRNERDRSRGLVTDMGWHQQYLNSPLEGDRNETDRSRAVITTSVNSWVLEEDDIASPAELAKAYMGNGPLKVSQSNLGIRSQLGGADTGLISNVRFTSRSPIMSSTARRVPENGFISPRSRGRSALYKMARTPHPRVHPTGIHKSLKRGSSILDDDLGTGGPMRRIRQKPNILSPRISTSVGKQKLPLVDERKHKLSVFQKNENGGIPSTSYSYVHSKSTEVASRILQHLDEMSPKEKPSEHKSTAMQGKTPAKLTRSMLHGKALRSLENMESSKLFKDINGYELEAWPIVTSPEGHDLTSQNRGRVESTGPKDSAIPHVNSSPAINNDITGSLKTSGIGVEVVDSTVETFAAQPPQKKQGFRMSALEDSIEQDDDIHCNGTEPKQFAEGIVMKEISVVDGEISPAKEPKLDQVTSLPEEELVPDPISSKRSDVGSVNAVSKVEASTVSAFTFSQVTSTASQSVVLPQPVSTVGKPKETNDSHPVFSFSSKTVNEAPASAFSSPPSESFRKRPVSCSDSKPENSSSLVNLASTPTGDQLTITVSDKDSQQNPIMIGDANGKSEITFSVTSVRPLFSSSPALSSTAASTSDASQISTGSSTLFTSSASIANLRTSSSTSSTSAASTSSIFGSNTAPYFPAIPAFKVGSSVDQSSTAVSLASTTTNLEPKDLKNEVVKDINFGSSSNSSSSLTSVTAASSGSSSFQFGSSVASTTSNLSQGNLFGSGSGSLMSGTVTQSMPILFSSSLPSSSIADNSSFASSLANSQPSSTNISFGFSSAASSSETNAVSPGSGSMASVFQFGVSTAASSDIVSSSSSSGASPGIFSFGLSSSSSAANVVGSASGASPSGFSFGLSSSSSATNAVGSASGATPSVFDFGGSSAASTSGINTSSSLGGGTSGIFSFGASSLASSSATNLSSSSSTTTNLFGSSWQSPKSPVLGSTFTSSPSPVFSFGASSSSFPATNSAPVVFNSSAGASSSPIFSFPTASAAPLSSRSLNSQPVFGNPPAFAASPGNDQMNAEDSMAEDTMQSSAPSVPIFGQPTVSPSPPGFMFGSAAPSQPNPFLFGGQQNHVAPQNPSPFPSSSSLEFSGAGSFSLGSGGVDKSGRKYVKVNRSKNRKK